MNFIRLLKHIPRKQSRNLFLKIDYLLKKTFLRKYLPLPTLYIEITSCCNLKCKGCYRTTHDYQSKNKHILLKDFKKYVDQVPHANSLYLHGLGEPMLHPKIKEIVEYARKSRKFNNIAFTTNALAKNPEEYSELFKRGLTNITVSVDSLLQNEVNKMRPFTDVRKLMKSIKWLLEKFPRDIRVSMVVNRINKNSVEKTLKKLYKIGLREVSFNPYTDLGYPSLCLTSKEKEEFLKKVMELKVEDMKFYISGFTPSNTYCRLPSTAPVITVNGYLIPCCVFYDENIINFGSLKEKTFKELFFSRRYSKMQKDIENGKYPSFCRGCQCNHKEIMQKNAQKQVVLL